MADVIKYRFRCRRRTAAEWTSVNEILLAQEIGLEEDTGLGKIGDGSTAWNDLLYTIVGRVDLAGLADGSGLIWDAVASKWKIGAAGGQVNTVVAGANVAVDSADPVNPIVSSTLGTIQLKGRVATYAALPSSGNVAGDAYQVDADGAIYIWDGSSWPAEGSGFSGSSSVPWTTSAGDVDPLADPVTYVLKNAGANGLLSMPQLFTYDPYWNYVVALLSMDGVNNSTTFTDAVAANTWSVVGSTKLSTAFNKYGTASATQADSGSQITTPYKAALNIGQVSGKPFTLEAWVKVVGSISGEQWLFGMYNYQSNRRSFRCGFYLGAVTFQAGSGGSGDSTIAGSAAAFTDGLFHHLAFARDPSNVLRIFVDGKNVATSAVRAAFYANTTDGLAIYGQSPNVDAPGGPVGWFMSQVRVTNGFCRYLSNFTPPLRAFYPHGL